jgi:hypothetical protein
MIGLTSVHFSSMHSTIIFTGLFKHTRGPTKTIGLFKYALNADLYVLIQVVSLVNEAVK